MGGTRALDSTFPLKILALLFKGFVIEIVGQLAGLHEPNESRPQVFAGKVVKH